MNKILAFARKPLAITLLTVLVIVGAVVAQQNGGTQVSQQATHYDAATRCASLDGASGSATLTPNSPVNSMYITLAEVATGATGTVTAGNPTQVTTSGIAGTPTFGLMRHDAITQGQVFNDYTYMFGNGGLKGQTGTAVSFTGAAVTNLTYHITICGYEAPPQ